jgi:hypothetical protein
MIISTGLALLLGGLGLLLVLGLIYVLCRLTEIRSGSYGALSSMGKYIRALKPGWYIPAPWQSISRKEGLAWTSINSSYYNVLFNNHHKLESDEQNNDGFQQKTREGSNHVHSVKVINENDPELHFGAYPLKPGQSIRCFQTGLIENEDEQNNMLIDGGVLIRGTIYSTYEIIDPIKAAISFSSDSRKTAGQKLNRVVVERVSAAVCLDLRTEQQDENGGEDREDDNKILLPIRPEKINEALAQTTTKLNTELANFGVRLKTVRLVAPKHQHGTIAKAREKLICAEADKQTKMIEGEALAEKARLAGVTPQEMLAADVLRSTNTIVTTSGALSANLLLPGVATSPLPGMASNSSGSLTPSPATATNQ